MASTDPTGALPARPVFTVTRKDSGEIIAPGAIIRAGNGDPFTFRYATRPTADGRSGKVFVTDALGFSQELYAHIFAVIVTRAVSCATAGCEQPATHTITYSFPESRGESVTESVCEACGNGYVSRPSLQASLTPRTGGGDRA